MNEKDPLADHSVCYYDLAKGAVVGGIEGRPAKLKARPGSVVRMTVDFDLCVVAVWIDEAQACVIHLTDDLLNKPLCSVQSRKTVVLAAVRRAARGQSPGRRVGRRLQAARGPQPPERHVPPARERVPARLRGANDRSGEGSRGHAVEA